MSKLKDTLLYKITASHLVCSHMVSLYRFIFVSCLIGILNISNAAVVDIDDQADTASSTTVGYSVLKLFLEDEQHLTFIRRAKRIVTFSDISDSSSKLIDEIADASQRALEELEKLEKIKPQIVFKDFSDDTIGKATFNSLRMASAKELLLEIDDFEKNLLLSQLKVLPLITHLAMQLQRKETNPARKNWLSKISERYEQYYQQVNARVLISS